MVYSDQETVDLRSTTIVIDRGDVREARCGHELFSRKRVFDRGRWTYSSGMSCPSPSLLDKREYDLAPLTEGKSGRDKPKINPLEVSLQEKIDFFKELLSSLNPDPRLSFRLSYRDSVFDLGFFSHSVDLSQTLVRSAISVVATAKGKKIARGIASDGQRAGWEFAKSFDPSIAAERALRLLSSERIKGGEYTVILDPRMVGTLIHEALGHMVEGDTIAAGASALAEKMGEEIASPLLSVVDDGTKGYGSFFFDRDGCRPKKTLVLDRGRLVSFLNSRDSGGQLGLASTGNCRGEFNQVRMTNTSVLPGRHKLDDMLDVKKGVYLCGTTGGTTSPSSNTFNFSAGEGWLVENGELTRNIGEATLSGDIFSVLSSVDMVGDDFLMEGGTCGKAGESVAIGAGGVSLRTKAIVGGSS